MDQKLHIKLVVISLILSNLNPFKILPLEDSLVNLQ